MNWVDQTTATSSNYRVWLEPEPKPSSPLRSLQQWLWDCRVLGTDRLGNWVSELRYWLWRLSK